MRKSLIFCSIHHCYKPRMKMTVLRNPLFSSILFMNMCKGHMSPYMLLNGSLCNKSLLKKFVNSKILMTIAGSDNNKLSLKMSPAPPSSTTSNDLHSIPFDANNKSSASFQTSNSSNSSESALLQLAKEFNKFYFHGKNDNFYFQRFKTY